MPIKHRPLPDISAETIARFWSYVDRRGPDECWPWKALRSPRGYGRFVVNHKVIVASRLAWLIHSGADPGQLLVCHRCDNPSCMNPSHLFLGTDKDNRDDMLAKGRWRTWTPEIKVTVNDVREIRQMRAEGWLLKHIAKKFNVSIALVSQISLRRTRKYVL